MLYLYRRIIFGELTKDALQKITDMGAREWAVFAPLILLTLWMGIYPAPFLDIMHVSVENLLQKVQTAQLTITNVTLAGR